MPILNLGASPRLPLQARPAFARGAADGERVRRGSQGLEWAGGVKIME